MLDSVLQEWGGVEVTAMDVYSDIFCLGDGLIQKKGEAPGKFKANPIGWWKNEDASKGHFRIMFDDGFEETLRELQEADFALLNCISYFGRRRDQSHASKMYAMVFDLDDVSDETLTNFLSGCIRVDAYPLPNYIVLSGTNLHLYYVFERPIPLFPNLRFQLKEFKYALTDRLWNPLTSKSEKPQKQGIFQAFRVIGGKTKEGSVYARLRAFRMNAHPYNLDQLGDYVPDAYRVDEDKLFKESKMTRAEAKKLYPDWYDKVIVNGDKLPKKWDIAGKVHGDNPYALYDWWFSRIKEGAAYQHRYFCIMCLAIYAVKCDVPYDRAWEDAVSLIPFLNGLMPDHPFTEDDVRSAFECFDDCYRTFPIKDIESISAIQIERNKRNGRKQSDHVKRMSLMRDFDYPDGSWRNTNGAPTKQAEVLSWRAAHPNGSRADCIRDTGISKSTVLKWWNTVMEEDEK